MARAGHPVRLGRDLCLRVSGFPALVVPVLREEDAVNAAHLPLEGIEIVGIGAEIDDFVFNDAAGHSPVGGDKAHDIVFPFFLNILSQQHGRGSGAHHKGISPGRDLLDIRLFGGIQAGGIAKIGNDGDAQQQVRENGDNTERGRTEPDQTEDQHQAQRHLLEEDGTDNLGGRTNGHITPYTAMTAGNQNAQERRHKGDPHPFQHDESKAGNRFGQPADKKNCRKRCEAHHPRILQQNQPRTAVFLRLVDHFLTFNCQLPVP